MPIDYGKTFSDEQAWFRETTATKEGFIQVGRAIEGTRGSLQRLTAQVKAADEIFTKTARRGEILGVRALAEYTLAHNRVNEVFSKSTSAWTHGFAAVQDHAQGATSHLRSFLGELTHFHHTRTEIATDFNKALERQTSLENKIREIEKAGIREVSQSLALRKSEADRMVVIGNWEMRLLEMRRAAIPLMVMWGTTVGRVLEQSFELQRSFRDINLDFSRSVDFTKTLLTAVGNSGGLVTMKEAAEAARTLRSYSLDFLKPEIIERVSLFHELTGVSSESIAKILYQLKSIGGSMPNINNLTNSFTYFARETDLGASGVADLLGKMDPLITSVPREMRETLITQVLALGDAFKKAGLNADEMIKTIQEMQDMTSSEGRKKAGLIASATGTSPLDLMMGNMDPAKIGYLWTQTQRSYMQRLTQGGRLNPQTAATILARRFGGSIEEWKIAGGKTDTQMSAMQAQMKTDEENANRVSNFSKALGEMTSGPIAKLSAILATLNRITLETGTNILQGINRGLADFNKKFPAVHKTLSDFFHFMTDEKKNGFRWAVATATKTIMILTPVLGVALIKSVWDVIKAGGWMISTFHKMAETIDKVAVASEIYTATQRGGIKTLEKEGAELAAKAAGGGILKKLLGWIGLGGLIGGGAASIGVGAAEGGAKGIGGWVAKLFGGGAGKGGFEIAEKGGAKLLEKEGAKIGSKGLSDMIPGLGLIVSMGWAIWDIFNILKDPKETTSGKTVKSLLKLIGGLLGGIPYIGWALSGAIDVWVASMDKNTDATKANTDSEQAQNAPAPMASIKSGGGTGAPPITGDIYSKAGVGAGGYSPGGVRGSGGGGGGGGGEVYQKLLSAYKASGLVGTVPPDGAKFGIKTGSAEEWARFGTAVANAESGFNPKTKNLSDPGGSFGIFQYAHGQVPGGNAYDVNASVAAFVRDSISSSGGLESGILGRRFSTIGRHPERTIAHLGEGGGVATTSALASASNAGGGVSTGGLEPEMAAKVAQWKAAVKAETGLDVQITEGRRSMSRSDALLASLGKGKAVAGGTSYHNYGEAIDYGFSKAGGGVDLNNEAAYAKAAEIASRFGLTGISNESGHIQNARYKSWRQIPKAFLQSSSTPRARPPDGGETAYVPPTEHAGLTATDRHGKAMVAELQASNRMNKERLHYLRQSRFLGPSLLPSAAEDTLANV